MTIFGTLGIFVRNIPVSSGELALYRAILAALLIAIFLLSTKQKIPFISGLKSYDKYYLNAGIKSYGKHIEELIQTLIAYDYEFVTFEELSEIMAKERA